MDTFREGLLAAVPKLRRFARGLAKDPALADDLVQDCLARALSRERLFEPGTNLDGWLFTILRNLHINHVRRVAPWAMSGEEALEARPAPGSASDRAELRELAEAMRTLPLAQREVLMLVAVQGMGYEEAAVVLGVEVGTVKSRLCRARVALASLMDGTAPQPRASRAVGKPPPRRKGTGPWPAPVRDAA